MNKYTPGPWHVETAHPKFTGDVRCDVYPPQDLPMGSRIPVATSIHPENARLIAAAPELFACVKEVLWSHGELNAALWNRLRTALANASGDAA